MSLLNEIQQKLKVPKGQYNAFAKYNYRNAEDILEAVKPLLGDRGILVINDEVVQVGDRYYVKATAQFSEKIGDKFVPVSDATGWAREELDKKGMDAAQITGAASSYARKYAFNGLFCIDDTKDADTHDNTTTPQNAPKQAPAAPKAPWVKNDPTVKIKAAKDRILKQLDMLKLPHGTKEECEASVLANTGLPLIESKLDEIGDRLALIIEENNTK